MKLNDCHRNRALFIELTFFDDHDVTRNLTLEIYGLGYLGMSKILQAILCRINKKVALIIVLLLLLCLTLDTFQTIQK